MLKLTTVHDMFAVRSSFIKKAMPNWEKSNVGRTTHMMNSSVHVDEDSSSSSSCSSSSASTFLQTELRWWVTSSSFLVVDGNALKDELKSDSDVSDDSRAGTAVALLLSSTCSSSSGKQKSPRRGLFNSSTRQEDSIFVFYSGLIGGLIWLFVVDVVKSNCASDYEEPSTRMLWIDCCYQKRNNSSSLVCWGWVPGFTCTLFFWNTRRNKKKEPKSETACPACLKAEHRGLGLVTRAIVI